MSSDQSKQILIPGVNGGNVVSLNQGHIELKCYMTLKQLGFSQRHLVDINLHLFLLSGCGCVDVGESIFECICVYVMDREL